MMSHVRLDPIPDGSFGFRAYAKPVDASASLELMTRQYKVAGVVTLYGELAVVTMTLGEIPRQAWPDFYTQLRKRGVKEVRWSRHREDGTIKPVIRSLI